MPDHKPVLVSPFLTRESGAEFAAILSRQATIVQGIADSAKVSAGIMRQIAIQVDALTKELVDIKERLYALENPGRPRTFIGNEQVNREVPE